MVNPALGHHKHFTAVEVLAQSMLHELSECRFLQDATFTDMWSLKHSTNPDLHRRVMFRHPNDDLTGIDFERMEKHDPWLAMMATVRLGTDSEYYTVRRIYRPIPYWRPVGPTSKPEIEGQYFLPIADLFNDDPATASATEVGTPRGRFVLDRCGMWHYASDTLGSLFHAAADALRHRPGPATFWFNGTFTPILAGDRDEDLCCRWGQWRAICQADPRLLEYMKELRTPQQ